jgi:serine phosphatase RsbU (regulator of sigma subunit)
MKRRGFVVGHLNRQSKYSLLIRGYVTVALITIVDYVTGPDPTFSVFYFLPIIIVSWYVSRSHGVRMALAASLALLIQDFLFTPSSSLLAAGSLLTLWGFIQRLIVFLMVGITVAALKSSEERKRQLEYRIARQVQSFLLPRTLPSIPHFSVHGFSRASEHLSGDLYDGIVVDPRTIGIVVGDICGKGVSAALLMAYIQGVLRGRIPLRTHTLSGLMQTVNRSLCAASAEERFASLFIGLYNDRARTLTYVNAGHVPPLVFRNNSMPSRQSPADMSSEMHYSTDDNRRNGQPEIVKLEPGGLLLGIDPSAEYTPRIRAMNPGDVLVCATDGVEEARNHRSELYGPHRLKHIVSAHLEESPAELHRLVMNDIEEFTGTEPQFDDITLVIGKVV